MRLIIGVLLALALLLAGCTVPVSCDDRERDGGIGGTGTCDRDGPEDVLAAVQTRSG